MLLLYSTSETWPGPYHNGAMRLDRSLAPDEVAAARRRVLRVAPGLLRVGRGPRRYRPRTRALDAGYASISAWGAPRLAIDHPLDPA